MLIQDPLLPMRADLAEIDRMLEELEAVVNESGAGCVNGFSAFHIDQQEYLNPGCLTRIDEALATSTNRPDDTMLQSHRLSLYVDSTMAELMHNYIHVVADLLQPARHKHNPYRSLYIPKAIEAAAGSLFVGATGESSHAGTALFHALLTVSASHLHRHRPENSQYGRLGRMYRIKAIASLQLSLTEPDEARNCNTIMSAMLSMVSVDVGPLPPSESRPTRMHIYTDTFS